MDVPADHRLKIKEREQIDKYLNLVRELLNLCNKQVTMIRILLATRGLVPKGLENVLKLLNMGRRIENIQSTIF